MGPVMASTPGPNPEGPLLGPISQSPQSASDLATAHYRIYESIWRNIDREDTLINQRISWAVVLSGGLFAATALLANALLSALVMQSAVSRAIVLLLMIALAVVGMIFSFKAKEGVEAAQNQTDYLKDLYDARRVDDVSLFEKRYDWPRPFGDRRDHVSGASTARIFPQLMIFIWALAFGVEASLLVWTLAKAAP